MQTGSSTYTSLTTNNLIRLKAKDTVALWVQSTDGDYYIGDYTTFAGVYLEPYLNMVRYKPLRRLFCSFFRAPPARCSSVFRC